MHIGGTRTSLLNLLDLLPSEDNEVYLYLLSSQGEYMSMINENVNIIKTTWLSNTIYSKLDEINVFQKIIRGGICILRKLFGNDRILTVANSKIAKRIERKFDVGIAFSEGEPVDFLYAVSADRKYAWIHNDYTNLSGAKAGMKKSLDVLNGIFFVANAAKNNFEKYFPQYSNKLKVIKNTINFEEINVKANKKNEKIPYKNNEINIISVGRITQQKAYEKIPEIIVQIRNVNKKFHWYIIGGGEKQEEIENKSKSMKTDDLLTFCGPQKNPYPYIKKADLLVLTSYYESQPMVILEALSLGVPVVSTNFSSAKELLENQSYGILCEENIESIAEVITKCLTSKDLLDKLTYECVHFTYDNSHIISEIKDL